ARRDEKPDRLPRGCDRKQLSRPSEQDPELKKYFLPLFLFALAFSVRLTFIFQTQNLPYFEQPVIDPQAYNELAQVLFTSKEAFRSDIFYQAPGYAYLLASVYKVFGDNRF